MKPIALTEKTTDHSDLEHFSFSFFCDFCHKEWISPKKPFSGGICSTMEKDEAMKLLWAHEHRTAFDEANLEAHVHFNLCPVCGKRVCDECFNPGAGEGGLCLACIS